MIASVSRPPAYLVSTNAALPKPIPAEIVDDGHTPAQTLADLYKRCRDRGGCPCTVGQLVAVLEALRYHGTVVATDITPSIELPTSAVYGCVLELEDYGLCRWLPEPVTSADNITAEITAAGLHFLREIRTREVRSRAG